MPDLVPDDQPALKPNSPRHQQQRKSSLTRVLLPMLFVAASVGLSYSVTLFLKSKPTKPAHSIPAAPQAATQPATSKPVEIPAPPAVPVPVQKAKQPATVEPPPKPPEGKEPVSRSSEARLILDRFLTAKTLAERLPLIETRTPESELEKSCLAHPLLPAPADKIVIETLENNPSEQVTDFYHAVDFTSEDRQIHAHIVLVRIRGVGEPKVMVEPFLDSYGGRLAAFAQAPHEKTGEFQVVVSALASCYQENIPNREKKLTLKLMQRDNEKTMAEAYFDRQSEIAQMLEDGNYLLSYGKAKACTVILRWNRGEDFDKPFLEAVKIKTPDWNP